MTSIEYLDEIKIRLEREDVAANSSDQLIMTYLNKARKQVQDMTLPLFPERYAKILRITTVNQGPELNLSPAVSYSGSPMYVYRVALPDDFIDAYEVIVMWKDATTDVTYRQQCRRVPKSEYWNVQMNAFAVPTPDRPIYTLEQAHNPISKSILVSGLNWLDENDANHTLYQDAWGNQVHFEIWYTAVLHAIELYDETQTVETEVTLPPDVDELVINYTIQYILQNTEKTYTLD